MTPATRVLPIFFAVLGVEFFAIPVAVGVWDYYQYLGDPTGATTISYLMARLPYAHPFGFAALCSGLTAFDGLVACLLVHFYAGMTRPDIVAELDRLRAEVKILRAAAVADHETIRLRDQTIENQQNSLALFRSGASKPRLYHPEEV